jgi:tetratricopeptide (TPR) repeat protein
LARPRVLWGSAGGALAAAACLWLAVNSGGLTSSWRSNRELQALVAAVGTDRPIEARLTGGFAYGAMRGTVRSGESPAVMVSPDVRIAAARSEKVLSSSRTTQALHIFGVANLVLGDLDRAIPLLEQAADHSAPESHMVSDLSAAYLARAARDKSHEDLMKALSAADRAVMADPALQEALFNRAIALERLLLVAEARAAWTDYLRTDGQSAWAAEARQRLAQLP